MPDLDELFYTLGVEGFVHHASMIHGDFTVPLEKLCRFFGIKPVLV